MNKGDWFRVPSRPGQVYQFLYEYKGDLVAYGGDKSPKGRRQYEAFSSETKTIPTKAPFSRKT